MAFVALLRCNIRQSDKGYKTGDKILRSYDVQGEGQYRLPQKSTEEKH
jgi:hypothetical protein